MTFKDFQNTFFSEILPAKPSYIRDGQCLMNYLAEVWIEEYVRIASVHYYDKTDIDCYYKDDLISNTLKHLEDVWYNFGN